MCVISGPVVSVDSTKILVMPSTDGRRQLTVYRNHVNTLADNMMILACPNPDSVKFETVPKNVFSQCRSSFMTGLGSTNSYGMDAFCAKSSDLEVRTHGSYEVVIVPTLADLGRVPGRFAILTPEVIAFLNTTYGSSGPRELGFVLCRLKAGSTDYEPMAYSHALSGPSLFVPTMHFHSHTDVLPSYSPEIGSQWDQVWGGQSTRKQGPRTYGGVDWDHECYSMCTGLGDHTSRSLVPSPRNSIDWNKMPAEFQLGQDVPMRVKEVIGSTTANQDFEFPIAAVSAPV